MIYLICFINVGVREAVILTIRSHIKYSHYIRIKDKDALERELVYDSASDK